MERDTRIELASQAWEACVLPLYESRSERNDNRNHFSATSGLDEILLNIQSVPPMEQDPNTDNQADRAKCRAMKDRSIDHMAVVGHVQNRSPERMATMTAVASITLSSRAFVQACMQYEDDILILVPGIIALITYFSGLIFTTCGVTLEGLNVVHVRSLKKQNPARLRSILHQIKAEISSLASVADRLDRYHFPNDQDERKE